MISAADKVEFLDCFGQKGPPLAEKMIYWTRGSRRRSKQTDQTSDSHGGGQERAGTCPITRASGGPCHRRSRFFNWPLRERQRERCEEEEDEEVRGPAGQRRPWAGWPLVREEIGRVSDGEGTERG